MAAIRESVRATCEILEPRRLLASVPAAPFGLEADAVPGTDPAISLEWDENATDEIGVRFYFRRKGATDWIMSEFPEADTHAAWADRREPNALIPKATYQFYVANYNSEGESEPSNLVEATMPPVTPPSPVPSHLAVRRTGEDSAVLTWRLQSHDMPSGRDLRMLMHTPILLFQIMNRIRKTATAFDGFTIYREDAGSYYGLAPARGRSFNLTGLIPGESHQYWVKSWIRFENRESIWSEESAASNVVELTA